MKNLQLYNVIELNNEDITKVQAGDLSDFGEWLTDTMASGFCRVKTWWRNTPKGYIPGNNTGYDGNAMGLPG